MLTLTCRGCGRDVYVEHKSYQKNPLLERYCHRCSGKGTHAYPESKGRKSIATEQHGIHEDQYDENSWPD